MRIIPINNKKSAQVESWEEIKDIAKEVVEFAQGTFPGLHRQAFAIHHCQVDENPKAFFAIRTELVVNDYTPTKEGDDKAPMRFPSAVIVNARIVEKDEDSLASMTEACMSFPFKQAIKFKRYSKITVEYQYPENGQLKTVREFCQGLKAQLLQHEIDHQNGKNIFNK